MYGEAYPDVYKASSRNEDCWMLNFKVPEYKKCIERVDYRWPIKEAGSD